MNHYRWNIEENETGLRVCRGNHAGSDPCEWELYYPRAEVEALREELETTRGCKEAAEGGCDDVLEELAEVRAEVEALQKENARMKAMPEVSEAVRAVVYGETIDKLRKALDDACTRMDRTREILRWSNDRGPWGLLDTAALRAALAAGRE